jgi:uncharacterized membrane protein
METKKSKYDTNPLEEDVVKRTEEVWGERDKGPKTQQVKGPTSEISSNPEEAPRANVYSEAPTRRYDNQQAQQDYPSVFVPPTYAPPVTYQQPPNPYQAPAFTPRPGSRPVPGIGIPENWASMLPYAPLYIGVVVSLLELFLVPRKEVKVRFHAAQGLALHIAILVISTLFGVVGAITDSSLGGTLFKIAATVFLVISMIRVWKGELNQIPPITEAAQWFNQHIEPRNK